jgi:hypothetical protein
MKNLEIKLNSHHHLSVKIVKKNRTRSPAKISVSFFLKKLEGLKSLKSIIFLLKLHFCHLVVALVNLLYFATNLEQLR